MFSQYAPTSRSMFTLVTASGITFSVTGDGTLLGGVKPLSKRIVDRIISGDLLVTTPHRAGGAFSERGAGGVYPAINAKAKMWTLADALWRDPRGTIEDGKAAYAAVLARYNVAN